MMMRMMTAAPVTEKKKTRQANGRSEEDQEYSMKKIKYKFHESMKMMMIG